MKKKHLLALGTLSMIGLMMLAPSSVSAFEGEGSAPKNGQKQGRFMGRMRRHHQGEGLVPEEIREVIKEQRPNRDELSEEELAELKEQHQARRQEHKEELIEFTGLSEEELKQARQDRQPLGEIVDKSEAEVTDWFTDKVSNRVDQMVEKFGLDSDQEASITANIGNFVQNMVNRWFGN